MPSPIRRLAERLQRSSLASRLAHGAFWSVAGAGILRVFTLAASVVTGRILGKETYGEYGILASTLTTFQAFAGLGLAMTATKFVAELRRRDPARAGRILALSAVVSAGAGLLTAGLLWAFAPWLAAHTLGAPHLGGLLRVASIGVLFATLAGNQAGALAGFEAFRTMARLNAWSGLLGIPITVAGVLIFGLEGAVWAVVLSAAVQWLLTHLALRRLARESGIAVPLGEWWREQSVLWSFSLPALAQGVMVGPVNWIATAVLVNHPGGYAEMGAYSAANQWFAAVLFLPTALCGPVLPVLSERMNGGDAAGARKVLLAAVAMNAVAAIPIAVAGVAFSSRIMGMYGPGFAEAWPTFSLVLATAGVVAIANPIGYVLAASGRLWLGFAMNSGWAAIFLGATVALAGRGAFGIAGARLIAYLAHAVWTVWFALAFLRTRVARATAAPQA
jgi:O-antigen/teichoic acid export membrane protein